MIKPLIALRKKTWLPIKFCLTKMGIIKNLELRAKKQVYERLLIEKDKLLAAERKRIIDIKELERLETIINTLEWFLNLK
jgi:hypothetical protein